VESDEPFNFFYRQRLQATFKLIRPKQSELGYPSSIHVDSEKQKILKTIGEKMKNLIGKDSFMGVLILILILFSTSPSWARDYYFKQSGSSDSNPCTQDSPCQSIAKAGSLRLDPGDRILFNRGDKFTHTSGNDSTGRA
jgi:hypothetical protein